MNIETWAVATGGVGFVLTLAHHMAAKVMPPEWTQWTAIALAVLLAAAAVWLVVSVVRAYREEVRRRRHVREVLRRSSTQGVHLGDPDAMQIIRINPEWDRG